MNEGREPKSLLWCELQQVQIDKLVNHRHGGEETSKQTHAHSPNWPVPLDIAFDQITQVKSVKFAHYTYVQIHALEPNPLDLLVNSVETDVKRPVQDNDLHVMSIHLSCCHKHFHRDALVHFSRQQFYLTIYCCTQAKNKKISLILSELRALFLYKSVVSQFYLLLIFLLSIYI